MISQNAFATGSGLAPDTNQTVTSVGGISATGVIIPLRANSDGSFQVLERKNALINATVTITGAGATQRTQFPTNTVNFCTMKANSANAGTVYIGNATVTNASGTSVGFPLAAGDALNAIRVDNSNELYAAADNANDKISILCN